jgi:hypothetical protein
MSRKPADTAHVNLRIRESLRRKLADEAEKHHFSLNNEIRWRLEQSLEGGEQRSLEEIAGDMRNAWERFGQTFHELNKQGDLLRAAEALVKAVERNEQDAIRDAVIRVKQVTNMIETEAKILVRRMHTSGGKQ